MDTTLTDIKAIRAEIRDVCPDIDSLSDEQVVEFYFRLCKQARAAAPEKNESLFLPPIEDAGFTTFVAYDIETTGLSPYTDSMIEIGAVRIVNGRIRDSKSHTFHTYVHPYKKSINGNITALTGITNEMVKDAPEMWDAFKKFADFIGDDIVLGYNNHRFDDKFMERAAKFAKRRIENKSFDVMKYVRRYKESFGIENVRLATISEYLGIVNPNAHTAVADALTTARVYLTLLGMK